MNWKKHKTQVKTHYSSCCEPKTCGCPFELDTNCVVHSGATLPYLDIRKGDRLEEILKKIDQELGRRVQSTYGAAPVGFSSFSAPEVAFGTEPQGLVYGGQGIVVTKVFDKYEVALDTEGLTSVYASLGYVDSQVTQAFQVLHDDIQSKVNRSELESIGETLNSIEEDNNECKSELSCMMRQVEVLQTELREIEALLSTATAQLQSLVTADESIDRVKKERFVGSVMSPLNKTVKEVMLVTFGGEILETTQYRIEDNILYILPDKVGGQVNPNDVITIIYTYSNF